MIQVQHLPLKSTHFSHQACHIRPHFLQDSGWSFQKTYKRGISGMCQSPDCSLNPKRCLNKSLECQAYLSLLFLCSSHPEYSETSGLITPSKVETPICEIRKKTVLMDVKIKHVSPSLSLSVSVPLSLSLLLGQGSTSNFLKCQLRLINYITFYCNLH